MDREAFAAKLRRALEAVQPPSMSNKTTCPTSPVQVDIRSSPVFRWKTTVLRDEQGQITGMTFDPVEQLDWHPREEIQP